MSFFDLDELADWAKGFCNRLLEGSNPYGCFLWRNQPQPNLMYINDVIMMKWALDDLAPSGDERSQLVDTLNLFQYPEGGMYFYPDFEHHSWQHGTATTLMALNMLGGASRYPLAFLEPLHGVDTCRSWVAAHLSPLERVPHHRYFFGAFVINSGASREWADTFFSSVDEMQDAETGFWPETGGELNISTTYMFSVIHLAFDRVIPRLDRLLDTMIKQQRPDGLFNDGDTITYHDMDAAFVLNYASRALDSRRDEALACLGSLAAAVGRLWQSDRSRVFELHPHQSLAIVSLASVLKTALGDGIPGRAPCRFFFTERSLLEMPKGAAGKRRE